jgi:hypothetical protein
MIALPWARIGLVLAIIGIIAGVFHAGQRYERPRAFKAGQVAQDRIWLAAIAKARAQHVARAKAVEAANERIRKQEARRYEADVVELRAGYDALRKRMRDRAARGGAGGGAGVPGPATGAGRVDGAGCADVDAIEAALVNASEEGDRYRVMVMGWQEWARGVGVAEPPD